MTEPSLDANTADASSAIAGKIKDFVGAFRDLLGLPRAFWFINVTFMIDSIGYFGILTLMTAYLAADIGLSDTWAGLTVSVFTGLVTLFMLGVGGLAERLGVRRGLILALVSCFVGRVVYSAAAHGTVSWVPLAGAMFGLLLIAIGEGMFQPIAYAGIKQYTDDRTSSMGYGLIYALMNLGIVVAGLISPLIRVPIDDVHEARRAVAESTADAAVPDTILAPAADLVPSGIAAVNWAFAGVTLIALTFFLVTMTKRAEAAKLRGEDEEAKAKERAASALLPWTTRVWNYFREGPFTNTRFLFFIFMLLPVQTLFAHQWLTMPLYILRAYPEGVGDKMEWLVNWTNPAIIFFGVPIATALTRRANVYTMMIVGSAVSAIPTFLLTGGPDLTMLITYLVVFSVGEALWQPRFLQYAAELAPEGKVAQYMGLANVPWITAKMTTGLYSGYMLSRYCPEIGVRDTKTMWLIYSFIALLSPIGLLLGRKWVMAGMNVGSEANTATEKERVASA